MPFVFADTRARGRMTGSLIVKSGGGGWKQARKKRTAAMTGEKSIKKRSRRREETRLMLAAGRERLRRGDALGKVCTKKPKFSATGCGSGLHIKVAKANEENGKIPGETPAECLPYFPVRSREGAAQTLPKRTFNCT